NELLRRDKQSAERNLQARTYSVIPLGGRFGMIQWVEKVAQLFSFYKRWQQRDYNAKLLQRKEGDPADAIPPPQRPHEQYYAKISAALKRYNLPRSTPRRQWPAEVFREVFLELESESPSDLLSKEIWCSSPNPSEWWRKTSVYARSLAVTSILGYIVGLGDRHLDNVLFDPATAEIVHIDFNVCFENGKRLRVPETVPFRLTRNLRAALGISGVEGVFRVACEHVLRVARENREVLLTLLDAFVYDPLVDW
ncbi:kinase-like domain-containing protein, partial [Blyttiomyces helicus]